MKMEQSVPKRRHIKFRRRGITQKKAYNFQNTAKVWNQVYFQNYLYVLKNLLWFFECDLCHFYIHMDVEAKLVWLG